MTAFADLGPILVIIPTYNESENVRRITGRVRAAVPEAHILVADDNSPDGTGDIADQVAAEDDHVHVLHRLGKEGLAAAYMAGFAWGLERGYEVLIEMDADGSHQPEQLPMLLAAARPRCAAEGRHGGLPGVPGADAARPAPARRGLAGLLLPGRHGATGSAPGQARRGGPDHVHGA